MKTLACCIGPLVALLGCNGLPLEESNHHVDIALSVPPTISWEDAHAGTGDGIRATVTVTGDRSYYATLGDGMLIDDEQSMLLAGEGGDAYVERLDGETWVPGQRPVWIEGLRTIVLRPAGTYTLLAYVMGDKAPGTYRIRVQVFSTADRSALAGEAVSNSFDLR